MAEKHKESVQFTGLSCKLECWKMAFNWLPATN